MPAADCMIIPLETNQTELKIGLGAPFFSELNHFPRLERKLRPGHINVLSNLKIEL